MSKIKIELSYYYNKDAKGTVEDMAYIDGTPEARKAFIDEAGFSEDEDWLTSYEDFVAGKTDSLFVDCHEAGWLAPSSYAFVSYTYEEVVEDLNEQIESLKAELDKLKEVFEIED